MSPGVRGSWASIALPPLNSRSAQVEREADRGCGRAATRRGQLLGLEGHGLVSRQERDRSASRTDLCAGSRAATARRSWPHDKSGGTGE
jgi:hypothetical protein